MRRFHWAACLSIALLLLLMLSGFENAQQPFPQILTVCPQGPPSCQFAKIQEAIEAARPNDTVLIGAGTYLENLTAEKSLHLAAAEAGQARIQGTQPAVPTLTLKAQGEFQVILDGLTILGGPPAQQEQANPANPVCSRTACPDGISVHVDDTLSSLILTLIDVQVAQVESVGLICVSGERLPGSAHIFIIRSRFTSNRFGGMLWGCKHQKTIINLDHAEFSSSGYLAAVDIGADATVNVKDTRFIGNRGGLSSAMYRVHATITKSLFQGNQVGLEFDAPKESSLVIQDGLFISNDIGVELGILIPRISGTEDSIIVHIKGSMFLSNRQYGLWILNPYRLTIEDNIIEGNGSGVMVLSSSNILQLNHNVISRNKEWGVILYHPLCVEGAPSTRPFFIQGEGNEIRDNGKGDLCPPDYPWPPGFMKP